MYMVHLFKHCLLWLFSSFSWCLWHFISSHRLRSEDLGQFCTSGWTNLYRSRKAPRCVHCLPGQQLSLLAMQSHRKAFLQVAAFSFHKFRMVLLSLPLRRAGTCTSNLSFRTTPEGVSGRVLSLEFVSPVWFTEPELVWSPRASIFSSSLGLHERGERKKSSHMLHRNLHILKGILCPCWNAFNGPQIRKKKKKRSKTTLKAFIVRSPDLWGASALVKAPRGRDLRKLVLSTEPRDTAPQGLRVRRAHALTHRVYLSGICFHFR